jgi:ribonuclease-3
LNALTQQVFFIKNLFRSNEDRIFCKRLYLVTGIWPSNVNLYRLAFIHSSAADSNVAGVKDSYERLEFLGDSILGSIVAEYLFKRFPFKDEGFLTEVRSRIVNREVLNQVGKDLGLKDIVVVSGRANSSSHKSLFGDVVEALIGALYLDHGYQAAREFVLHHLLSDVIDVDTIIVTNKNFKSILLEYCQKEGKKLEFAIVNESGNRHQKVFTAAVLVDGELAGQGNGFSKKKAEQHAAEQACIAFSIYE